MNKRTEGKDVHVILRVRRENLPNLEKGVQLGIDADSGKPIVLQLEKQDPRESFSASYEHGIYALCVTTREIYMHEVPDAVSPEMVEEE